ncbi:ABC transporter permease [Paenibacillus montanisoli]|uniref:Sugar ABC transporter permease n=1 Tax=Paenibacillus montanisoli TaxID=2081970 RepID=A0A328U7D2_9BACL|nr:ABC transporter permease subunit [Paenibacillus montanisoli]RAP78430.1 sugar ABC transporter permease [Paenibacillus montanisoli]
MNVTKFSKQYVLHLFLIPALVLTLLFNYAPMFGNVVAFMDYSMFDGWMGLGSPWVGLDNFKTFLSEQWFYDLALRTLTYSISILIFSFPASLILALLLNELRNQLFKKIAQTVSYIPHFVSWVTVAAMLYMFLSVDMNGLVNNIKVALFGGERLIFMQDTKLFLPLLIVTQVWKEMGWGSILYLAAISVIDPHLYEAAAIDGAGRWRQMIHVTLPGLVPTTVVLMIFTLGSLFGGNFDQMFNMQNIVIQDQTNIISTYIYYQGVKGAQFSISTAVGLFGGVISFILLMIGNYVGKKISNTSIV